MVSAIMNCDTPLGLVNVNRIQFDFCNVIHCDEHIDSLGSCPSEEDARAPLAGIMRNVTGRIVEV